MLKQAFHNFINPVIKPAPWEYKVAIGMVATAAVVVAAGYAYNKKRNQ